jgi:DNA invertase Pin-like site-specific DNA recombinase
LIGERVRDKIAASKRKGLWVGGPLLLGYLTDGKKLVLMPTEAKIVRTIFALYLEIGSIAASNANACRERIENTNSEFRRTVRRIPVAIFETRKFGGPCPFHGIECR